MNSLDEDSNPNNNVIIKNGIFSSIDINENPSLSKNSDINDDYSNIDCNNNNSNNNSNNNNNNDNDNDNDNDNGIDSNKNLLKTTINIFDRFLVKFIKILVN